MRRIYSLWDAHTPQQVQRLPLWTTIREADMTLMLELL